jgi:hypothetical protein
MVHTGENKDAEGNWRGNLKNKGHLEDAVIYGG